MQNKKKIIVTGAAGFIGKNLVLRLLKENYYVLSVDYKNPNIKHKYNMRLCDILDGCPDTHLSSIGHKIVADSIKAN